MDPLSLRVVKFANRLDFTESYNLKHPSIQRLQTFNLHDPQVLKHKLTNNDFMDNVLVAILLFLLVILLKGIITRIVYMRPRFSSTHDTITYFSQARIVLLDNNFFLRWVRRFRLFDSGHYTQRNHMQYSLVMLATLAMFLVDFGLIVPGLPANRPIYLDSDKIIRWESEYLDKGRIIVLDDEPCIISPILLGPNLKSESSWSYCQDSISNPYNSTEIFSDKMKLTVSRDEASKANLLVNIFVGAFVFHTRYTIYISLDNNTNAVVGLSDDQATLVRNLQRNFDLLRNVSGLTFSVAERKDDSFSFWVNNSQVKYEGRQPEDNIFVKTPYTIPWIRGMIQGVLTVRTNGTGSQLYVAGEPLKKTKILVGTYIGTLAPAFFIVAFTAGTALVYIVVRILLRSPPGGAWELLEAHKRDHRDRILAGPSGNRS